MAKKEKLNIDYKLHLGFSKDAEKLALAFLKKRCPEKKEELWGKVKSRYEEFVPDLPFLGGKKNYQARGVYDSVFLLALYDVCRDTMTKRELESISNALFVPAMEKKSFADFNKPLFLKCGYLAFKAVERTVKKHEKAWPGNYLMEVEPFDKNFGIRYKFTRCPIAEFAKSHGFSDVMPLLCNADYPMLKAMHASLIRTATCASGNFCDYRIVGDRDPALKDHPLKRISDGLLYNE